jgi:hypothetical protein
LIDEKENLMRDVKNLEKKTERLEDALNIKEEETEKIST